MRISAAGSIGIEDPFRPACHAHETNMFWRSESP